MRSPRDLFACSAPLPLREPVLKRALSDGGETARSPGSLLGCRSTGVGQANQYDCMTTTTMDQSCNMYDRAFAAAVWECTPLLFAQVAVTFRLSNTQRARPQTSEASGAGRPNFAMRMTGVLQQQPRRKSIVGVDFDRGRRVEGGFKATGSASLCAVLTQQCWDGVGVATGPRRKHFRVAAAAALAKGGRGDTAFSNLRSKRCVVCSNHSLARCLCVRVCVKCITHIHKFVLTSY
jgi:hypothetical protein